VERRRDRPPNALHRLIEPSTGVREKGKKGERRKKAAIDMDILPDLLT